MTGLVGILVVAGLWAVLAGSVADRSARRLLLAMPGPASSPAMGSEAPARSDGRLRVLVARFVAVITLRERREARGRDRHVVEQLPDVVDLLRLAALAGLPVASAIAALESRPGGPVGAALRTAASRLARGATTGAVLAQLPDDAGPATRSLVDALIDHDRYGTPLGPALDRLAVEYRQRRRRQAEEAARRLPVLLLFPLVLTTLPAFVLLTVVPLLVGSFSSLPL